MSAKYAFISILNTVSGGKKVLIHIFVIIKMQMALTCDGNISTVPTAGQDVNNICTIQHNIIPLKRWKTEFWDFYYTRCHRQNVRL